MSNDKPLSNGHAPAKTLSQSAGAIRSRLFKERKRRGAIVIRDLEIGREVLDALTATGWLHESEARSREAVEHALAALLMRSLQSGVTPSNKPLIEIDLEAVRDAWTWARPGSQPTAENAAKALSNVAKCSALVGFGPSEFGNRLMRMVEERAV